MNKIRITIDIETNFLSDKEYLRLLEPFYLEMKSEMNKLSFDDLNKIFNMKDRNFIISTIESQNSPSDSVYGFSNKVTKININGI